MNYYNGYNYGYWGGSSSDEALVIGILMVYLIVLLIVAIGGIVSYIFKGIGMSTIAKREGMEYPVLAFVPFARTYLHGELAGDITFKKRKLKHTGIWFLVLPFVYGIVYLILYLISFIIMPGLMFAVSDMYVSDSARGMMVTFVVLLMLLMLLAIVFSVVYNAFRILVNYRIYGRFTTDNMALIHAVLGCFIPLYEAFCLFALRNKPYNPGMEPRPRTPYMAPPPYGPYYGSMQGEPQPGAYYGPVQGEPQPGVYQEPVQGEPQPGAYYEPTVNAEQAAEPYRSPVEEPKTEAVSVEMPAVEEAPAENIYIYQEPLTVDTETTAVYEEVEETPVVAEKEEKEPEQPAE